MQLRHLRNGVTNGLMTVYALVTLYPLFWLFVSSLKSNEEFYSRPFQLPTSWHWDSFSRAWKVSDMGTAMFNSVVVTALSLVLTLAIGALAAYVLSRFQFRLKLLVMGLFLLGMLIPIHSTLVPLFIVMNKVHLLNTYGALIFPYAAFELPIAIFILQAYMNTFPKEIEEAAFIDGMGYWGIFGKMMLPLSAPALATVGILAVLRFWNDFSFALVFISKPALKTLPLSLSMFATGYMTDYQLTMAALAIAVIPTIVVYLIFQRPIMQGMVAGAVKG
ncbi:carbohydrate ABC transporter permease [Cohnella sp. REN36]|uniref:carbohydrate ABC transporter permease n=1 Tax=Cohnella sp. REN36 TaxID=2887347 RepID=UPI001D13EA5C|nr:carbohydrate ABC transporter permease [Cohnella sp. REN36]MCC3375169.1 carbohydrate ABC transporter permease [Cohnella sp. REN36]